MINHLLKLSNCWLASCNHTLQLDCSVWATSKLLCNPHILPLTRFLCNLLRNSVKIQSLHLGSVSCLALVPIKFKWLFRFLPLSLIFFSPRSVHVSVASGKVTFWRVCVCVYVCKYVYVDLCSHLHLSVCLCISLCAHTWLCVGIH